MDTVLFPMVVQFGGFFFVGWAPPIKILDDITLVVGSAHPTFFKMDHRFFFQTLNNALVLNQ